MFCFAWTANLSFRLIVGNFSFLLWVWNSCYIIFVFLTKRKFRIYRCVSSIRITYVWTYSVFPVNNNNEIIWTLENKHSFQYKFTKLKIPPCSRSLWVEMLFELSLVKIEILDWDWGCFQCFWSLSQSLWSSTLFPWKMLELFFVIFLYNQNKEYS